MNLDVFVLARPRAGLCWVAVTVECPWTAGDTLGAE